MNQHITNFKAGRSLKSRRRDKVIEAGYRKWIGNDAPCVKCWGLAVDLIHLRGYAQGNIKPPPWHTLTSCRSCHVLQETNREFFAPLSIGEAQDAAADIFNAYEIAQDKGLWLERVTALHGVISS